jgi:hypothetical protein
MTPCGTFVFASAVDTRVYCWNVETGDLVITNNMDLNYLKPPRDIHYHPYDHMIAFASYGPHSPVFIFNYDGDVATRNLTQVKQADNSFRMSTLKPGKLSNTSTLKPNEPNYLTDTDNDLDKYSREQLTHWKRVQTQLDAVYVSPFCISIQVKITFQVGNTFFSDQRSFSDFKISWKQRCIQT